MIKNLDKNLFCDNENEYKFVLNLKQELKTDNEKIHFENLKEAAYQLFWEKQSEIINVFYEKTFCKSIYEANLILSFLKKIKPIKFTITFYRTDGSSVEIKEEDLFWKWWKQFKKGRTRIICFIVQYKGKIKM